MAQKTSSASDPRLQLFHERYTQGAREHLLIPASQHPLVDGRPGPEFTARLNDSLRRYESLEGAAQFFLGGSRHHDKATNHTDRVALYDAAALWLLERGVDAANLHGRDWIDECLPGKGVYSGTREIAVAAHGYRSDPRLLVAHYICSPGQSNRAMAYGKTFQLPLLVTVPEVFSNETGIEQFHDNRVEQFVLNALAHTIDPSGERVLSRLTANRVPEDRYMDTLPEEVASDPRYALLYWHQSQSQ